MVTHAHIGFKIEDYQRWKDGYDASVEQRKASGEISYMVFRDMKDPLTLSVISVQKSAEKVQAFIVSPDLKDRMKAAGITQMGQMFILEELDGGTH